VKAGETLWTIAVVYGIPVAQIQFINNMGATIVIYEGQKLKIKEAGPTWTPIPDSDLIELQTTTTISVTGTLTTSPTSEPTLIALTSPEVTIRADDPASGISLTGSLAEQANTPTPQPEVEKSSIELTDQNLLVGALVFAGSGVLLFGLGWYFSARARKETKS
jgi:LysM repeat protein